MYEYAITHIGRHITQGKLVPKGREVLLSSSHGCLHEPHCIVQRRRGVMSSQSLDNLFVAIPADRRHGVDDTM